MVPISVNQDTVGPIARSVADAAAILGVIAGRDALDNFTLAQPARVPDYTAALRRDALRGVRLGVPRLFMPGDQNIVAAFNASLDVIRALGATVVDPAEFPDAEELLASNNETLVLDTDFKVMRAHACVAYVLALTAVAFIQGRRAELHRGPARGPDRRDGPRGPDRVQQRAPGPGARRALLHLPIRVRPSSLLTVHRERAPTGCAGSSRPRTRPSTPPTSPRSRRTTRSGARAASTGR